MVEEYFRLPGQQEPGTSPRQLARERRDRALPACFADAREMRARAWQGDDFWFGESPPELHAGAPIDVGLSFRGSLDDRGVMIIAGNGGGKGVSLIVPNLLTWPGGMFCIDVKGELASYTATRRGTREAANGTGTTVRRFLGQDVAVLDPFREVKGPASTKAYGRAYNPLLELDPASPAFVAEVRRIAAALTVDEHGEGRFFSDMAKILIAGVIEVVVKCAPARQRNLATVSNIMVQGEAEKFLAKLPDGLLARASFGALKKAGDRQAGAFHSTVVQQWGWLDDPRMRDHLKDKSGFSLIRHVQNGGSTYVCMPVTDLATQRRWLRLMLTMGLTAKLRQGVFAGAAPQTLFMIDEMPALGPLDMLEEGVGYMRGYGVKPVSVIQNLSQLENLYAQNWETFIGNTGATAAFSMMDDKTPKFVADRLGTYQYWEENFSESHTENRPAWTGSRGLFGMSKQAHDYEAQGGGNTSRTRSKSKARENVLQPEEVRLLTSRETARMIVIAADGRPLFLKRVPYWDRFGKGQGWYEERSNIARIEGQMGKLRGLLE